MASAVSIPGSFIPGSRPLQVGMVATALLLGYVGPFGSTESLGQALSTLFWTLVVFCSIGSVQLLRRALTVFRPGWSEVRREIVLLGVFTAFYTPQVQILLWLFGRTQSLDFEGMAALGVKVFAISVWVAAMRFVLHGWRRETEPHVAMADNDAPEQPRLYHRIPSAQDADILHLAAEDHYVVVALSDGSTQRILLRLSDAIAEMDGIEGYVTHRSHWVAASAVAGVRRDKGRVVLTLANGQDVPVSRGYQSGLKDAGLLD